MNSTSDLWPQSAEAAPGRHSRTWAPQRDRTHRPAPQPTCAHTYLVLVRFQKTAKRSATTLEPGSWLNTHINTTRQMKRTISTCSITTAKLRARPSPFRVVMSQLVRALQPGQVRSFAHMWPQVSDDTEKTLMRAPEKTRGEGGWRRGGGGTLRLLTPLSEKKKREVTKTRRDAGAWTLWGNPRFRSRMRKPESFSRECATQQAVSSAVRRRPPPAWSPLDAACVRASDNCWTLVLTPNPERRGLVSPRCDEEKKRGGLSVSNDAVRRTSDAHVLQATF